MSKFVRGFRIPTQKDIDAALGDDTSFSKEFKNSFSSLPTPTSELDWLANYNVKGQTFEQYLENHRYFNYDKFKEKYIYLTLLDNDDRLSILDIDRLIDYTQRFYQIKVKLLPLFSNFNWNKTTRTWTCTIKNDTNNEIILHTRYHSRSRHSQICVYNVLDLLQRSVPVDAHCLVAITLHDFYSDESDLFVAGFARGGRHVAAFSFFRYNPYLEFGEEFWYDWRMKKAKSKSISNILLLRSCRLLTHEIGHLFGIAHCIYYKCLMNGSGHLEEDFSQPLFLCPVDLRKLSQLAEFDFIRRYEELLEFCRENEFEEEIELLNRRLDILKNEKQIVKAKKNKNGDHEQKQITKRLKQA